MTDKIIMLWLTFSVFVVSEKTGFASFNKVFGGDRFYDETKNTEDTSNNFYKVGDRIAQIMIIPHPQIEFEEVEELSDSERGEGGFGSTGK